MSKVVFAVATGTMLLNALPSTAHAQLACSQYLQDVPVVGASANEELGGSVAISGSTMVVGVRRGHALLPPAAAGEGTALVYARSGSAWTLQGKLMAEHPLTGDFFGHAVAVEGDTIVVGAPWANKPGVTSDTGCFFVFERSGSAWVRSAPLFAPDGAFGDGLGNGIALSGDMIAVSSASHAVPGVGTDAGAVYIFKHSPSGWAFHQQVLSPEAHESDRFGRALAMSADTLVVGADIGRYSGTALAGAAYVFVRDGDTWSFQAKLTHDADTDIEFGWTVALDADTAIVTAPKDPQLGTRAGSAYVFTRDGATWTRAQKILAPDAGPNQRFGVSAALDGATAIIGAGSGSEGSPLAPGHAYIFSHSAGMWAHQLTLQSPHPAADDAFGWAVALEGPTVVIGDRLADAPGAANAGSASVFQLTACCPVDLTHDGLVDFTDYLEFLNLYDALDPTVDFNGDGLVDFADYLEFLTLYDTGC